MKAAFAALAFIAPLTAILLYVWFERTEVQDLKADKQRIEFQIESTKFDAAFNASRQHGRIMTLDEDSAKKLKELEDQLKQTTVSTAVSEQKQRENAEALREVLTTMDQKGE